MYNANNLNAFINDLVTLVNKSASGVSCEGKKSSIKGPLGLSPAQGLVIAGLVLGLFEVTSVLVNKDRVVQIVLSGSLATGEIAGPQNNEEVIDD